MLNSLENQGISVDRNLTQGDSAFEGSEKGLLNKSSESSLESQGLVESSSRYVAPAEPPAKGAEMKFAAEHGFTYALGRTIADFVPYARFLVPSEREHFMKLDQQHQTRALLWEAFDAALWGKGQAITKGSKLLKLGVSPHGIFGGAARDVKYLGGGVVRKFSKTKRAVYTNTKNKFLAPEAFESLAGEFNYTEEATKLLKKMRFRSAEREGIEAVLGGGTRRDLFDAAVKIAETGGKHSKAWKKLITKDSSGMYPGLKLLDDFASKLNEENLYKAWKRKTFKELLETQIVKMKLTEDYTTKNFRLVADKLYGKNIGIDDVAPDVFSKVTRFALVGGKRAIEKAAIPGMGQYWIPVLKPVRFVFGHGEKFFQTSSNVYRKIKLAVRKSNENYFNSTLFFHKLLDDAGLGKLTVKINGEFKFKGIKSLVEADKENAFKVLQIMDDLSSKLSKNISAAKRDELLLTKTNILRAIPAGGNVEKLMGAYRIYSDYLYSDLAKHQLLRNFRGLDMTPYGKTWLKLYGRRFGFAMDSAFGTTSSMNNAEKVLTMQKELKFLDNMFQTSKGTNPLFKAKDKELETVIEGLKKSFAYDAKEGWMPYLSDYTSRLGAKQLQKAQGWKNSLFKDRQASFLKKRKLLESETQIASFSEMLERRTLAQSNEIFLYDDLNDVVEFIQKMPWKWQNYTEHYVARVVNKPSMIDHQVADILQATVGKLERALGFEGNWDAARTVKLAQTINDFTYAGALGLKPYSALRNLFQVSLVPGDLGGVKDIWKTAEGYVKAFSPARRAELRQMKIITEWAPEISLRPKMLKLGVERKLFGTGIPSLKMSEVREFCLWGFKSTDTWNRYVTGSAAIEKWNGVLGESQIRNLSSLKGNIKEAALKRVYKDLNLSIRDEWIEMEIKQLLRLGKFSEAKTRFVQNVVGNTQFLFGAADAPMITGFGGSVGKTGFIFQSWWMNYGAQINKLIHRGSGPEKIERIATTLIANGMAYGIMSQIWGSRSAKSATFLGPIPKAFNEFLIPPAFTPIYHVFAGAMAGMEGDLKTSNRHWWELTRSLAIFTPGGLQATQMYRGFKRDGAEGLGRSILKLKAPMD